MRRAWQSPWIRYGILGTFLALIAAVSVLVWYRNPRRGLPYHDQSVNGQLNEWQQFGGIWNLDRGSIRNVSNERGAKLVTGSPFWTNYKAEADFQLLGLGDVGIVLRASDIDYGVDSYRGYLAALRTDDQALVLGRADYGWLEFSPIPMPGGVRPNRWYHLAISAYDCAIHASATSLDTGQSVSESVMDPDCTRSGKIALRSFATGGVWRHVEVHALDHAEGAPPAVQQLERRDVGVSVLPGSGSYGPQNSAASQYRVELLPDADSAADSVVSIGSLRLLASTRPVRVTVRGAVTVVAPATYIQDATGGARVVLRQPATPRLGDEIEVTGDAHRNGLSVQIENATSRTIAGNSPIPAFSITPLQAALGRYDGMFVELEGRVESKLHIDNSRMRLDLTGGQQEFYGLSTVSETAALFNRLEPGSLVRLRGTCVLSSDYTNDRLPFALIVRSPDDLEVLSGPPWWSTEHLAEMAAGMLALGFLIHRFYSQGAQRKQLRDVINTIPAYVWSSSPDGAVDFLNQPWLEFTGLSLKDALGWNWETAVHPDDRRRLADDRRTALSHGIAWETEMRQRRADGEYRWWLARNVPLRDKLGKLRKWYGTGVDIDDRKRAEKERERLRQLEANLSHLNRVSTMGELAASLSHEIKQPLAAAMTDANTSLRWLNREQPNLEKACEAASRMVKDVTRAAEIIDRLRSFYKKGTPPERELVDVNDVLREMLVLLRNEANRHSIVMSTELAHDAGKASADRVQIQQVLMNLMLNGIEAMKESGGELTVKSQLVNGGQIVISVRDTGVGLPAEKAEHIFDAFFSTKPQGSGMGLTISRSIIEAHDGRLWAEPNSGRGATFHFTLPTTFEAHA